MNIKVYDNQRLCLVLYEDVVSSTICMLEIGSNQNTFKLSYPKSVKNSLISDISNIDNLKKLINKSYDENTEKLRAQLVSTNASDYSEEYNNDVLNLKARIKTVAKRLSESDLENEDESFGNLLTEIWQLKKQLGSFANEYTQDARKKNGTIKYKIRELEKSRERELGLLDLNVLDNALKKA